MVGVFVNSPVEEVNSLAESCRLDCVQLSGDESWEYCLQIKKPLVRAIHIAGHSAVRDIIEEVEKAYRILAGADLICLLDTWVKNAYGGTGQKFDWQLAREVCARFPVMIAGGLAPENLAQLIAEVHPWGVDVSSGVETGGRKDLHKIQDFIAIAKG
jgi:phosphoribosylanthranilate isomerase